MLFAIPFPMIDPNAIEIGPIAIRWYALAYIAGIVIGWRVARWMVQRTPQVATAEQVDDYVTWVTLGIILGGLWAYEVLGWGGTVHSIPFIHQKSTTALLEKIRRL